jgi:hypothetical protein
MPEFSPDRKLIAHFKDIIFAGLSSSKKCAGCAQNGWRHCINLVLAHQAQRHSVSQFWIHTH